MIGSEASVEIWCDSPGCTYETLYEFSVDIKELPHGWELDNCGDVVCPHCLRQKRRAQIATAKQNIKHLDPEGRQEILDLLEELETLT